MILLLQRWGHPGNLKLELPKVEQVEVKARDRVLMLLEHFIAGLYSSTLYPYVRLDYRLARKSTLLEYT